MPDSATVGMPRKAPLGKSVSNMLFDAEYTRLNDAQKQAVDTVEGPVMVVAGPGTGKTQVLALRVANILKKTQARPGSILCLTFSTAGATAMRERLRRLIGGDAYAVTVSTVHGFCDSIISRNPMVFADRSTQKAISEIERYKTMQKLIDEISDHAALINPKNPYERIPAILGRISDCKREGKTIDDLLRVADEYDGVMAHKSKEGTKQHDKNLLQARRFRDFVGLFRRYSEVLQEKGLYDYDDMILTVISALNEEEWLLAGLQERYQYILVDEAQDLNGAQWKVIERLTTSDISPNDPNFFLVGDDDQAIYRFQGANLTHMLAFNERFPKAPIIVLTENYRSTQKILDAAGRLIKHNEERLIGRIPHLVKDLKAANGEEGLEPVLLRPPSDAAEPWLIADIIHDRLAQDIKPEDIAVLVQTNGELRPIYDVLRASGIPVVLEGKADLLSHPVVRQVLTILNGLDRSDDDSFLQALSCACFNCHSADIARVIAAARSEKRKGLDVLLELETRDLRLSEKDALINARDTLLDLRMRKDTYTVLDTVEHVLRRSGISSTAAEMDPLDLAVVEAFFQYVKSRCSDHPSLTLHDFLQDIRLYADEAYGQIRLTYQLPHLVTSGVKLLTAHQSKGLEFHTVILSAFREGHWDERRNPSQLAMPEDLLFGWEDAQKTFEKHQDERRVAFVAMTRAERELIMLCPKEFAVGERARPVSPSAFFAEAGPLPETEGSLKNPEASSLLLQTPLRDMDSELEAYLREKLENFALSPSALSRFLADPQEFLRVQLLNQPEELSEDSLRALGYGSAVHWALRKWAEAMQAGQTFGFPEFLLAFEWHLHEKNILTEKQRFDLLAHANSALPQYFAARLEGQRPVLHAVEREYRSMLGDIPLKGKIDRIDLFSSTSGDAVIIDYKTGRPKAPGEIRGGLAEGIVSRTTDGDYFRQLTFYAVLLEQAEPLLVPQAFSLEFIGERGDGPIRRDFTVTEAEKNDLRKLIQEVWGKIQNLDFTPL
jgi:DNA helicase II / ATP-dependent DNA helicase PcrA